MVNTHWGGVVETNEFGTHEYFELLRAARRRGVHQRQRRQRHGRRDAGLGRVHDARQHGARWPSCASGTGASSRGRSSSSASATRAGAAAATCCRCTTRTSTASSRPTSGSTATSPITQDRVRRELRRLRVDRGAHGARRRAHGRPEPALLHDPDRRVEREGLGDRVRRLRVVRDAPPDPPHGRAAPPPRRDHGQVRPRQARRPHRRRVGHVVRRRARDEPRLPVPAEHDPRRRRRGAQPQHLPPARRPGADDEHRADGQRAAGDAPHRRRADS